MKVSFKAMVQKTKNEKKTQNETKNVRCSIKYVKSINYIVECISIIVIFNQAAKLKQKKNIYKKM